MFLRALLAFLMVPVVVAGIVPFTLALYDPFKGTGSLAGGLLLAIGLAILLWCVRDFYVSGKGTLAPWDPPKHLVTVGLYRYVRNPNVCGCFINSIRLDYYHCITYLDRVLSIYVHRFFLQGKTS